ncbi:hypothetical protein DFA_09488 [Cavenderia fasciculata]|uniref:Uncharacterized protein n=1 Tax=Cavenderia fasciculata TaxID=261658 RepID=F4Q7R9_CACFS|nr:uncharacterized protein DFA_09488 [Cavenderia fasciculata]EGG15819.1 hypothetical protein DFA_09488 [Cavenderia fasciculata]|eukprot:XP_004352144.1 hypothetical protein DFA_09488 [Cavenderia fasciculata]
MTFIPTIKYFFRDNNNQASNDNPNVTQYIKVGHDGKTLVSDPMAIRESMSGIGFLGPPGAGKSTCCNTICHVLYQIKEPYFLALDSHKTVTTGVYTMSREARMKSPVPITKEVMDMEGHDHSLERSWKLAMLLSVMCEEVVLCNRDARSIVLIQAVEVFKKGMEQSKILGMRCITKQLFVMVKRMRDAAEILSTLSEIIPDMEFIPFTVPQFTDDQIDSLETPLEFHPDMVNAIKTGILDKIKPRLDQQALSSKAETIQKMLEAFNRGDFSHLGWINKQFFLSDCKRILTEAISNATSNHITLAKDKQARLDMTFQEFIRDVKGDLIVDFTQSTFYIKETCDTYIRESFQSPCIPFRDLVYIYQSQYDHKIAKLIEAKAIADQLDQNKRTFLECVETINQNAKSKLTVFIQGLKFDETKVPDKSTFIDDSSIVDLQQRVNMKPDYTPFNKFYSSSVALVPQKWKNQVNRAKWKMPVQSQGELTCKAGCRLNDDPVVCSTCGGYWYWIDGPTMTAMCKDCLRKTSFLDDPSLVCTGCKSPANCTTRPNLSYIP